MLTNPLGVCRAVDSKWIIVIDFAVAWQAAYCLHFFAVFLVLACARYITICLCVPNRHKLDQSYYCRPKPWIQIIKTSQCDNINLCLADLRCSYSLGLAPDKEVQHWPHYIEAVVEESLSPRDGSVHLWRSVFGAEIYRKILKLRSSHFALLLLRNLVRNWSQLYDCCVHEAEPSTRLTEIISFFVYIPLMYLELDKVRWSAKRAASGCSRGIVLRMKNDSWVARIR